VLGRIPSPTIAALVGSQYYWIQHVHPVGLLGYIVLLEGYPQTAGRRPDAVSHWIGTGGIPHAAPARSPGPHHGEDLDRLLDSLPLTEQQLTLIGLSAIASLQLITQAQQELLDRF
jgi:hypothetical protein